MLPPSSVVKHNVTNGVTPAYAAKPNPHSITSVSYFDINLQPWKWRHHVPPKCR